ncbi:hypothetical protein SEUCBS139899_002567 [Sporothrix eucalyptigena]|uniref:Uncharacterized protein n=1 Tax=Sporothrix eucalyptigena TaxID=1812306 RepID=A0ABP0B3G9_9PEZI
MDFWLAAWRAQLPKPFCLDRTSIDENEMVTKQKTVLKLRFYNARILLHHTFLISASTYASDGQDKTHVRACVDAASATMRFVYNTYLYRPCYNCIYILDATMVLLYVILSSVAPSTAANLVADIEKSLEIFSSMRRIARLRVCAVPDEAVVAVDSMLAEMLAAAADTNMMLPPSDPLEGLVGPSLVFDVLNFEDWSAWMGL